MSRSSRPTARALGRLTSVTKTSMTFEPVSGSVLLGATRTLVGLVIDDTIKQRVFTGPGRVGASVSPMFDRGRAGIVMSLGF